MQHAKVERVGKDVKVCMKTARPIESTGRGFAQTFQRLEANWQTQAFFVSLPAHALAEPRDPHSLNGQQCPYKMNFFYMGLPPWTMDTGQHNRGSILKQDGFHFWSYKSLSTSPNI